MRTINIAPPEYRQGDMEGNLRRLFAWARQLTEEVQFQLTVINKDLEALRKGKSGWRSSETRPCGCRGTRRM